jgi:hypothetical protein
MNIRLYCNLLIIIFTAAMFIVELCWRCAHAACDNGLEGWEILTNRYISRTPPFLDGITFQWDYFMIHSSNFTGSVGYVVADPRNRLVGLMPSGGNVAISGKFLESSRIIVDYVNFGTEVIEGPSEQGYYASAETREFYAAKDGLYARIDPVIDNESLILRGHTTKFDWELSISQDWSDRCNPDYLETFTPVTGHDVNNFIFIPFQYWTVDMNWLRTKVKGTITDLTVDPPETVFIDGHGYREQAWGPWAFNFSGWDFAVVSDESSGVQWALQTYHHSETLDYLDVSFYDNETLKAIRFSAKCGELGWHHNDWKFETAARQCVPTEMSVVAQNSLYTIEAQISIGSDQIAMLSDLTPITENYVIMCRFPFIEGTISRTASDEIISIFSGQGGGEFSIARLREDINLPDDMCEILGERISTPLPYSYMDSDNAK